MGGHIEHKNLEKAMRDVLINVITSKDIQEMCSVAQFTEFCKLDLKLFSGLAAMSERILYPKYMYMPSEKKKYDDLTRMKIETADFSALEWKFHNVKVNEPVRK